MSTSELVALTRRTLTEAMTAAEDAHRDEELHQAVAPLLAEEPDEQAPQLRPRLDLGERAAGDLLALGADSPELLHALVDGDQRPQRRRAVRPAEARRR